MVREVVREQVGRKRDEVVDDHTIRFDDCEENELELKVTSASIVASVSAFSAISALGHPHRGHRGNSPSTWVRMGHGNSP